jgi:long-chain acyl-CoA synthetase
LELLLPRIERIARQSPERIAIDTVDHSYTYDELVRAVRQFQAALSSRGVGKDSLVALVLPDGVEFIIAHLALLRLGAISAIIHSEHTAHELERQLADVKPTVMITMPPLLSALSADGAVLSGVAVRIGVGIAGSDRAVLFSELLSGGDPDIPAVETVDSDLAAVVFTSGVSGAPRGVELTHGNLAYHAHYARRALRVRETDRVLCACSSSTIFGLALGLHLPLASGAASVLATTSADADLVDVSVQRKVSTLISTPTGFSRIKEREPDAEPMESVLRLALCCDGKLRDDIRQRAESRLGHPIALSYGSPETGGLSTVNVFPHDDNRNFVGEPLAETEIAILDEEGKRQGSGKDGQIAVRGPAVFRGYRGLTDHDKRVLEDGWFLTGDFGSVDYHGCLNVTAYAVERMTKGGFPVNAGEIEDLLCTHPAIKEAAVIGIADPVYGEELKACVVLRNGNSLSANDVIQYAKDHATMYKCPRIIKFYKELPRTPDGKIRRMALREDRA